MKNLIYNLLSNHSNEHLEKIALYNNNVKIAEKNCTFTIYNDHMRSSAVFYKQDIPTSCDTIKILSSDGSVVFSENQNVEVNKAKEIIIRHYIS